MCSNCKYQKYTSSVRSFGQPSEVPLSELCNAWAVQNAGNMLVVVNQQWILQPGQSLGLGGNEGEIFAGRLDIQFAVPTPAPVTPNPVAVVMQKIYVE